MSLDSSTCGHGGGCCDAGCCANGDGDVGYSECDGDGNGVDEQSIMTTVVVVVVVGFWLWW